MFEGFCRAESTDRAGAIRIAGSPLPAEGTTIAVIGNLTTVNGERVVRSSHLTVGSRKLRLLGHRADDVGTTHDADQSAVTHYRHAVDLSVHHRPSDVSDLGLLVE